MRVIGGVVPMTMAGIPFLGPAVVMAMAVIVILVRQGGMALDFGDCESGWIM